VRAAKPSATRSGYSVPRSASLDLQIPDGPQPRPGQEARRQATVSLTAAVAAAGPPRAQTCSSGVAAEDSRPVISERDAHPVEGWNRDVSNPGPIPWLVTGLRCAPVKDRQCCEPAVASRWPAAPRVGLTVAVLVGP